MEWDYLLVVGAYNITDFREEKIWRTIARLAIKDEIVLGVALMEAIRIAAVLRAMFVLATAKYGTEQIAKKS